MAARQITPFDVDINSIERFGAREDATAEANTVAIQAALDAASGTERYVISIPDGRSYDINELSLTKRFVSLVGRGELSGGTLNIGALPHTASQADINAYAGLAAAMELRAVVDGPTFRGVDGTGKPAIRLAYAREVDIRDIRTVDCDYGVDAVGPNGDNFGQGVARIRIRCGVFSRAITPFRATKGTGNAVMHFADWLIAETHMIDKVVSADTAKTLRNIDLEGIDGLICLGNYAFMSANTATLAGKAENVRIRIGANITISANQLFEAGTEAVLLDRVKVASVQGNTMVFPGQRVVSAAVRVTGGDNEGDVYCAASIAGNTIEGASGHGIRIDTGADYVSVGENSMVALGASARHYGGGAPLGSAAYAVSRAEARAHTTIARQASNALQIERRITVTTTGDSQNIEIEDAKLVLLNNASQLNISSFLRFGVVPSDPEDSFTVRRINAPVQVYDGTAIVMPDGVHRNLAAEDEITFTPGGDGKVYVKSMALIDRAVAVTTAGSNVVLDIKDGKTINYTPASTTNVIQFTKNALPLEQRSQNYEIMLLCANGNVTLTHDATKMNCPGAVDLVVPSGGIVQINNVNGKVYVKGLTF